MGHEQHVGMGRGLKQPWTSPKRHWALQLNMADFPYPRDHHGQWFWEGGFDKDPIKEAEEIRDWNFRAVYGAFNAMKNGDGADKHKTAFLTWMAFIGGPRESRRLMGDIVLKQDDVVSKVDFPDGCVPSTWSIDLHYPKKQYSEKFPDNPFISVAVHDRRIDRSYGYPVPYRCFYSRNIDNLFMAGRCISVTHEALGTTRVMRTCGMMGEVVGKAASLCVLNNCGPRGVYESHWNEMDKLLKLPGKARRKTVHDEIVVPDDALPLADAYGPTTRNAKKGVPVSKLKGLIIDDKAGTPNGQLDCRIRTSWLHWFELSLRQRRRHDSLRLCSAGQWQVRRFGSPISHTKTARRVHRRSWILVVKATLWLSTCARRLRCRTVSFRWAPSVAEQGRVVP